MGKVVSRMLRRQVNRFNVESRTHRILEQDKPVAAPKFESNIKDMERALEVDPQLLDKLNKKDSSLNDRLRHVYVTSKDSLIERGTQQIRDPNRPLPLERGAPEDFEYGYSEPKRISIGRCSLRQALEFIIANQREPETWTNEYIADKYKLKHSLVANILFYYKSFNVHIPNMKFDQKQLPPMEPKLLENKEKNER